MLLREYDDDDDDVDHVDDDEQSMECTNGEV